MSTIQFERNLKKKRKVTATVIPLFHIASDKHPLKPSNQDKIVKILQQKKTIRFLEEADTIGAVESFSLPPPRPIPSVFREKTGKRTLTLRGRMARPDARETRENGDSIRRSETRYTGRSRFTRNRFRCVALRNPQVQLSIRDRAAPRGQAIPTKRCVSQKIELSFIHSGTVISAGTRIARQ